MSSGSSPEVEALLRSEGAGELLVAAVGSAGARVDRWELERVYSGAGTTSGKYLVRSGDATLRLIISTTVLSDDEREAMRAVRMDSGGTALHIWSYPVDPQLPGLASVEHPERLPALLGSALGTQVRVLSSELVVLRPLRRAVHRMRLATADGERTVFVKTVRPHTAAEHLARHRSCSLSPAVHDAGSGVLVMEEAEGLLLTSHLYRPTAPRPGLRVPAEKVFAALGSISEEVMSLPRRTPPAERLEGIVPTTAVHGAQLGVEDAGERAVRIADAVPGLLRREPGPLVPVHGDFHPGNVFLSADGETVAALIDLDTAGPGFAADDAASFLAHLAALPAYDPAGYRDVPEALSMFWDLLSGRHPEEDLSARVSASLLSLVPGARTAEQAEHLLSAAEAALEGGIPLVTLQNHVIRITPPCEN